jgi:hypothetical protein
MEVHNVVFRTPKVEIGKADFIFYVRKRGKMLGRLKVSRGGIVFVPRKGGKRKERKISWAKLAKFTLAEGRRTHRP